MHPYNGERIVSTNTKVIGEILFAVERETIMDDGQVQTSTVEEDNLARSTKKVKRGAEEVI